MISKRTKYMRARKMANRTLLAIGLVLAIGGIVSGATIMTWTATHTTHVTPSAKNIKFKAQTTTVQATPFTDFIGETKMPATLTASDITVEGGNVFYVHFLVDNKCGSTATFTVNPPQTITIPSGYTYEVYDNSNVKITGATWQAPNNPTVASAHFYYKIIADPWIEDGPAEDLIIKLGLPSIV